MNLNVNQPENAFLHKSKHYADRSWSVIPVWGVEKPERSKVATCSWTPFMSQRATAQTLHYWFVTCQHQGIGIVTGPVSGLAVLDFDAENRFREFCKLFPQLANTYIVKTPRGWHLYFRVPHYLQTYSRQTDGIDWQWQGRYVVAPPTAGYCVKNDQNPRLLTQKDLSAIEGFINVQKPVEKACEPQVKSMTENDLLAYYSQHAHIGHRNKMLFDTGRLARDYGWSLQETIDALASVHAHNGYGTEDTTRREREAIATLKSVFSRPPQARSGIQQLPNTIREHLLSIKQMSTLRLIEGLRLCGYQPGDYVTWQEAWGILEGVVGRDSILKAFHASTEQGRALFEKVVGYEKPSPKPPTAHANPATYLSTDKDTKCLVVTVSKSGKSQTMGAPTHYFRLPSNIELGYILGVGLSLITDLLSLEDLSSVKTTRQVLHRGYIARRPGTYSNGWLTKRLAISKSTKNRYDRAIPDLHKTPTYTIKPIYWHTLDEISDEFEIRGQFLEDETGRRYPPKRVIAIKLLKSKLKVRLMIRGFNYYWVGNRFEVNTQALTTVIVNNQKVPDSDFSDYWQDFYGRQAVSVAQHKPKQAKNGDLSTDKGTDKQNGEKGVYRKIPHNRYQPLAHDPTRPFADPYLEQFAKGIQHSLNQMSTETSKHISLRNARRLVATYGLKACKRQLKHLKQRPADTVDSPVGLFTVMLRSNHVKTQLTTSSA